MLTSIEICLVCKLNLSSFLKCSNKLNFACLKRCEPPTIQEQLKCTCCCFTPQLHQVECKKGLHVFFTAIQSFIPLSVIVVVLSFKESINNKMEIASLINIYHYYYVRCFHLSCIWHDFPIFTVRVNYIRYRSKSFFVLLLFLRSSSGTLSLRTIYTRKCD